MTDILCEQTDVVLVASMDVLTQFIVNAMLWWYLTEGNGWISLMFKPLTCGHFYIYSRFTGGFFALTSYTYCSKIKVCCKPVSWLKLTSPILFQRRDAGNYFIHLKCSLAVVWGLFWSLVLRALENTEQWPGQDNKKKIKQLTGGDHTLRTSEKLTWLGSKSIFD